MAAKKIEFTAKNVKAFSAWLKKFYSIDSALLLEIDEANSLFSGKTYNEERSVVKHSTIKFDEAGFTWKSNSDPQRIKVGIYNIQQLMKVMDQFNDNEFTLTVNWDEVIGETTELAGKSIMLKNNSLKMNVECTSLNIFKYISDELFTNNIAAMDESVAEFKITKEQIEKTISLCNLDSEYKFMEFKQTPSIYVAGKTFDFLVEDHPGKMDEHPTINIFKDQFSSVDIEDYDVRMGEDRLIFTSGDESTVTVVSMVEKD